MPTVYLVEVVVNTDEIHNINLYQSEFFENLGLSYTVWLQMDDGTLTTKCLSVIKDRYITYQKKTVDNFYKHHTEIREIFPFPTNVTPTQDPNLLCGLIIKDRNSNENYFKQLTDSEIENTAFIKHCNYNGCELNDKTNKLQVKMDKNQDIPKDKKHQSL